MNPEQDARLSAVEQLAAVSDAQIKNLREDIAEIKAKLDTLLSYTDMGKGAWCATMRVGRLLLWSASLLGLYHQGHEWGWWR